MHASETFLNSLAYLWTLRYVVDHFRRTERREATGGAGTAPCQGPTNGLTGQLCGSTSTKTER